MCISAIIGINAYKQRFAIISNHSTTVSCSWIFIQSALSIYYPSIQYAHLVDKGILYMARTAGGVPIPREEEARRVCILFRFAIDIHFR